MLLLLDDHFYPRLIESLSDKIITGRVNTTIRSELVSRFPNKYKESLSVGSVKTLKRGEISAQDLADDIITIIKEDKPEWTIDGPEIRLAPKPDGLSGKFQTIFFTIDGQKEKFVLRGEQSSKASSTPISVKECLPCYFYSCETIYKPFKKTGKEEDKIKNYTEFLEKVITDIEKNGIDGCHQKDIDDVLTFLKYEVDQYNLEISNAIFNALSIGNFLRSTKFSEENWIPERGDLFDYIKDKIGRELLGFSQSDKWNPMDIMLVKPGSEDLIKKITDDAKDESNEDLQLGMINSMFVNDLESDNENSLILAISLKEQRAQAGKAKGYLKKLSPDFNREYNLTSEEKSWYGNDKKLLEKIVEYRKFIKNIINSRLKEFTYDLQKGDLKEYNMNNSPLNKYAALKLTSFILTEANKNKNIFTGIVQYGLSLEKNPTFFKLKGNIEGDEKRVEKDLEKFPSTVGVQLYNPQTDDFDGKIRIIDSNENMGINIEYYIEFGGVVYYAKLSIRSNQSGRAVQVTIEISEWYEYKDMNENIKTFYPRIFEKFNEEGDPI